jgi:serine/threonine protein kinase
MKLHTSEEQQVAKAANDRDGVLQELAMCESLQHQNLVSLVDAFSLKNVIHLVFLHGGSSLREVLKRSAGGLPVNRARSCFRQVATGLAYVHSRFIIHNDLKPENILVEQVAVSPIDAACPAVRIADFGCSLIDKPGCRTVQNEN